MRIQYLLVFASFTPALGQGYDSLQYVDQLIGSSNGGKGVRSMYVVSASSLNSSRECLRWSDAAVWHGESRGRHE